MKRISPLPVFLLVIMLNLLFCGSCDVIRDLHNRTVDWLAGYSVDELPGLPEKPAGAGTKDSVSSLPVKHNEDDIKILAGEITEDAGNDYEKMEDVYDWVTHNFAYDLDKAKDIIAGAATGKYGSGAFYLLETGKGVCHDFADLTRALLEALDITATYETGDVQPYPGEWEPHAWNHVQINETWYALDTTWGAGFIIQEGEQFVQKPRRLYLNSVEEMRRLHSDLAYREEREIEYSRRHASGSVAVSLPDYEQILYGMFNRERELLGLPSLEEDSRLLDLARYSAVQAAEDIIEGKSFSVEGLEKELNRRARQLRIGYAGMATYMQWFYSLPSAESVFEKIRIEQGSYSKQERFTGLSVGVIQKGDLLVVVHIHLDYY